MPQMCGCQSGSNENGWHEKRSAGCVAEEKKAFSKAIKTAKTITQKREAK